MMKIYFAGAIRGGREKVQDYTQIVHLLEEYGEVLTTHVADGKLSSNGENMKAEDIYLRDIHWLNECDILLAEISVPSLGVGYEIAYAEPQNKKIVCMYENNRNVSAMIRGNNKFVQIPYSNMDELLDDIRQFMEQVS